MKFATINDKVFYKADRDRLWESQGRKCYYCHKTITRSEATMDHVTPLKKVKIHHTSNCVVACLRCNQTKGCGEDYDYEPTILDTILEEWYKRVDEGLLKFEYSLTYETKGSYNKWKKWKAKQ